MATKKTQEEIQAEAPEIQAEKPADEWQEEVEMYVPRRAKGEDQSYPVFVNDRRYWVPANGKKQMLPKPVAAILQNAIDAENAMDDYINQVNERTMENTRKFG